MRYHHYDSDTQLRISILGKMNNAMYVLLWCLEAVDAWLRNKRLQLVLFLHLVRWSDFRVYLRIWVLDAVVVSTVSSTLFLLRKMEIMLKEV